MLHLSHSAVPPLFQDAKTPLCEMHKSELILPTSVG